MTTDEDPPTAEEQRIRDALRALPQVPADAEFRARMRREFAAGGIVPRRRSGIARWALAASLLLALGGALLYANRGEPWRIVATSGVGVVEIDGRAIELSDSAALESALVPGVVIATDAQAEVQFAIDDILTLVVTPESTFRVPNVPGRFFARDSSGALERGEVRGSTGRLFAGARLRIELPDAVAEITGTTFAVLRNAEGSCVCVLEGVVSMREGERSFAVGPLRRRVIPPGETSGRDEPIRPMEEMKLQMLRDQLSSSAEAAPD